MRAVMFICAICYSALTILAWAQYHAFERHKKGEQQYRAAKVYEAFFEGYHQCEEDRKIIMGRQRKLPK